jgi:hypothetical protein
MAATIDKDLMSTLKAARGGKPMRFAFFPKGSESKLLVAKKLPPQEIAETKKEIGASSVFKGRCVGEGGTLVFYVAKDPPGTLLGQLRKRLKADAGVTWPIEIRVSADAEAEPAEGEAEAAGAAAAPGTSGGPRAAWEKALAEVVPAYLQGLRDLPDKASALRAVMGFAQGKAQKEDFAGAIAALRKLAEQLAKSPANGAKTAPGPEPVSPAGGDLAAQWKKNLAEWTPALKAALAAKGPNAVAIAKLMAQAVALAKPGGDMAQALEKLTECHALAIGRTADGEASAGAPVAETAPPTEGQAEPQTAPQTPTARPEAASPSPPPTGQPAPTDAAALQAEYERRVLALEPKVLEAEKTRKGQAKWLTLFMSAQDRGSEGEFDKAFQILDKLEALLNAKGPETLASKDRLVKERQFMLTRWARIPAELKVAFDQYKKLLIKEQADPNPDELIAAMEAYLLDLLAKIQDDLDAAINAGEMSRFVGLRTRVATDKLLAHLLEAPAMDGAKFQGAILTAMDEIEAALAA